MIKHTAPPMLHNDQEPTHPNTAHGKRERDTRVSFSEVVRRLKRLEQREATLWRCVEVMFGIFLIAAVLFALSLGGVAWLQFIKR